MSVTVLRRAGSHAGGPAAGGRGRFRLHRAGLVGLYEYENETFEFERGRLLLRGPNGAGKSKALELLLPLLLDGELRAERLDPFGGRGRSMRWNLIGEDEARAPATGFSWLELHGRDERGADRYTTLVLMARADRGETGVKSWFAVLEAEQQPGAQLHGPRIGISASLTHGRTPLTKQAFAELAGGLIESASEYRERVNTLLFGVAQDRYEAIIRLLLSLRKPQLSQTLNPDELSARLTEALPELDRDAVLRVSARLDDLDALRAEAASLREVRAAVATFARTYRDWARAALRERGGALEEAVRESERRRRGLEAARAALAAAQQRRADLIHRRDELDEALAVARASREELRAGEEWRDAERLDELRRRADQARREASDAEQALERASHDAEEAGRAAELAAASLGRNAAAAGDLLARAAEAAQRAGVSRHPAAVERLAEERRDLDAVGALLGDLAGARHAALSEMEELAAALRRAHDAHLAAQARFEEAEGRQRERQAERAETERRFAAVREDLLERLEAWLAGLELLALLDEDIEELGARVARAGDPEAPAASSLVAERAAAIERRLHAHRADAAAARRRSPASASRWQPSASGCSRTRIRCRSRSRSARRSVPAGPARRCGRWSTLPTGSTSGGVPASRVHSRARACLTRG